MAKLTAFQFGYLTAALFSTNDQFDPNTGGDPLDANYTIDDIDPTCLDRLCLLCNSFETLVSSVIDAAYVKLASRDHYRGTTEEQMKREQAGHDLWMTSNGHGCGFWDGDWSKPHASYLTQVAKSVGSVDLYVGDDQKIYAAGFEA